MPNKNLNMNVCDLRTFTSRATTSDNSILLTQKIDNQSPEKAINGPNFVYYLSQKKKKKK